MANMSDNNLTEYEKVTPEAKRMAQAVLHDWRHNRIVLDGLADGDLVEFSRNGFSHWGVYVGYEHVVHLVESVNARGISSYSGDVVSLKGERFGRGSIKLEPFWDVVKDGQARKKNDYDEIKSPLPRHEIKRRALESLGPSNFNLFWRNCKHFASWCRYDVDWSKHSENEISDRRTFLVETGTLLTVGLGALVVLGGIVTAIAAFIKSGTKNDDEDDY